MATHYVYILKCQNGRYYVGYSRDVETRLKHHQQGAGSKFSRDYKVDDLVYLEKFSDKFAALARENQLKGWNRAKKDALINGNQLKLKTLSISRQSPRYK